MGRYAIGDRVEAAIDCPSGNVKILAGYIGTVCGFDVDAADTQIGVAWDLELPEGHNCGWSCEEGHGWYVKSSEISPYEGEAIEDINESSFLKIVCQECEAEGYLEIEPPS